MPPGNFYNVKQRIWLWNSDPVIWDSEFCLRRSKKPFPHLEMLIRSCPWTAVCKQYWGLFFYFTMKNISCELICTYVSQNIAIRIQHDCMIMLWPISLLGLCTIKVETFVLFVVYVWVFLFFFVGLLSFAVGDVCQLMIWGQVIKQLDFSFQLFINLK